LSDNTTKFGREELRGNGAVPAAILRSVVAGIRSVRRLTAKIKERGLIAAEEQPGDALLSDQELMDYVCSVASRRFITPLAPTR
jgi:hypothetical protein